MQPAFNFCCVFMDRRARGAAHGRAERSDDTIQLLRCVRSKSLISM